MQSLLERDWIALDGRLEPIDFAGFADDRSPAELAEMAISTFSAPGDYVLDPFAGLGTTLLASQRLGRPAIGFETNQERQRWVSPQLLPPSRVVLAAAQSLGAQDLPPIQLAFTSPPYPTVRLEDDHWGPSYFEDMSAIFHAVGQAVVPSGHIVVEVSNIRTADGYRPLVGQMAEALGQVLQLEREIVRVNTSLWPAGPGVQHSTLLIFRPRR